MYKIPTIVYLVTQMGCSAGMGKMCLMKNVFNSITLDICQVIIMYDKISKSDEKVHYEFVCPSLTRSVTNRLTH